MRMVIYAIKNNKNSKLYIGQTSKTLEHRWVRHVNKDSGCKAISAAIKKYGAESFYMFVLQECSSLEEMNSMESHWIKILNTLSPNGYNLTTGGEQKEYCEETRKRLSASMKGIKRSEEFREKCRARQTGVILTEKTKKNMSNASVGKPKSESHRANISKAKKGTKISDSQKQDISNTLSKNIKCNETGEIFKNAMEASKTLNIGKNNIVHILKGRKPSFKGFSFSYV